MISVQTWSDAQLLWDFQQMHHEPRPCSVGIGLGSHDLGVADATVNLYQRGMFPLILFTGATSRTTRDRMPRGKPSTIGSVRWNWAFPRRRSSLSRKRGTRARTSTSHANYLQSKAWKCHPCCS